MPTLHLICGLPGSGKSAQAKKLEKEHLALRLTPDEWMQRLDIDGYDENKRAVIESLQWEIAQQALRLGINVILESGFWSRRERDEFRALAKDLGATTKLYFMDAPREELWKRLEQRNTQLSAHTFHVKESDLDVWITRFEPPTTDELEETGKIK